MVVHRDRWLLVVDKPSGLPTQAPRGGGDNLYDRVRAAHPGAALHHRLDAGASGLVLFGLDPSVDAPLTALFRTHAIARTYLAVGVGEAEDGTWDRPIEGRPARSRAEVLGRDAGLCALRLHPETGRTHQLRIHAALAGAPLAGDRRYGGDAARRWPRLALHATRLALRHPGDGSLLSLTSALPDDLRPLWEAAGGPPQPS